jgi:hypothetical protein
MKIILGEMLFEKQQQKIIIFSEIIKNQKLFDQEKVFGIIMKV